MPARPRRPGRARPLAIAAALAGAAVSSEAAAQVHSGAAVEVGVARRLARDGDGAYAAERRTFGPFVQASGEIAVLPLLRAGVYGAYDGGSVGGSSGWVSTVGGGVRARVLSPVLLGPLRPSLILGVGGSWALASGDDRVGRTLDLPVGLQVSAKLRRPWELLVGVGARIPLLYGGARFTADAAGRPSRDTLLPALTVGLHAEL